MPDPVPISVLVEQRLQDLRHLYEQHQKETRMSPLPPFSYIEPFADGEYVTPVRFTRPYTPQARRFARACWNTYHEYHSTTELARWLNLPRTTLRRWVGLIN